MTSVEFIDKLFEAHEIQVFNEDGTMKNIEYITNEIKIGLRKMEENTMRKLASINVYGAMKEEDVNEIAKQATRKYKVWHNKFIVFDELLVGDQIVSFLTEMPMLTNSYTTPVFILSKAHADRLYDLISINADEKEIFELANGIIETLKFSQK